MCIAMQKVLTKQQEQLKMTQRHEWNSSKIIFRPKQTDVEPCSM